MIRREALRLRRVFHRLLVASIAAPGALASCSANGNGETTSADAGVDASIADATGSDDAATFDATTSADSEAASDAAEGGAADVLDANCTPSEPYPYDSGGTRPCYQLVDFPCGPTLLHPPNADCTLSTDDCLKACADVDGGYFDCTLWPGAGCTDGAVTWSPGQPATVGCGQCIGVGRRPRGLARARGGCARDALGEFFARAAHLEAASVVAFEALREQLAAHGAPEALLRMAERAARDEVRHARVTTRLARRRRAEPSRVCVRRSEVRDLESIARENAVEGCVRETYGALVAAWQAQHACARDVRAAMRGIARDELRHAALAWAIARWADSRLDAGARRRIARARRRAIARLERDVASARPTALVRDAGIPSPARARELVAALRSALWSSAAGARHCSSFPMTTSALDDRARDATLGG